MTQLEPIARARSLLEAPVDKVSPWSGLAAMALAAFAAILMAGAVVLGPGFEITEDQVIVSE